MSDVIEHIRFWNCDSFSASQKIYNFSC